MNHAQSKWVTGSLVAIGFALAFSAMEWDARPPRDAGLTILTIYETAADASLPSNIPPPPSGFVIQGERLRHGFYVRREWGPAALAWGGILPLCLFAVAGFVALRGRGE
jgi:hypothetical protein